MIIESGITLGAGITVNSEISTASMRNLLSASGQTAYDAATGGNWFSVSSTDYANVVSGLASVTKYCLSDAQMSSAAGGWSGGYAQAYGANLNAQLSAGTYVIGFGAKPYSTITAVTPLISTALPTSGTYSPIANSPAAAAGAIAYFLRRPSTATAATSYLGFVGNNTMASATISGITNWYSTTGSPNFTAPWTVYNANPIMFQALGTPTYQWT